MVCLKASLVALRRVQEPGRRDHGERKGNARGDVDRVRIDRRRLPQRRLHRLDNTRPLIHLIAKRTAVKDMAQNNFPVS